MDLEPYRPVATGVILLCLAGIGALKMAAANKIYKKKAAADSFLGSYPMSPRPLTAAMDVASARQKFVAGLRQVTVNQGWSIKHFDPGSSHIEATMRWSSRIIDQSGFDSRYRKVTQVNSTLVVKAEILSQGSSSLLHWSYDSDASSWTDPSNHRRDPMAEDYAIETNFLILQSLGLV